MSRLVAAGLAPWQERRAKEMIDANLDGVPIKELARECRLWDLASGHKDTLASPQVVDRRLSAIFPIFVSGNIAEV
ncbi:hypothetical protein V1281_004288 [Nitrobacteraceae bacterium AZCC 2161]